MYSLIKKWVGGDREVREERVGTYSLPDLAAAANEHVRKLSKTDKFVVFAAAKDERPDHDEVMFLILDADDKVMVPGQGGGDWIELDVLMVGAECPYFWWRPGEDEAWEIVRVNAKEGVFIGFDSWCRKVDGSGGQWGGPIFPDMFEPPISGEELKSLGVMARGSHPLLADAFDPLLFDDGDEAKDNATLRLE